MPVAGRKPCLVPGCPNLAVPGSKWCRKHSTAKKNQTKWVRRSGRHWREDAGYGNSGWQVTKMRNAVLLRDNYTCQICGHQADPNNMKPRELMADHIKAVALGGKSTMRNMRTLCAECHEKKTHEDIREVKDKIRKGQL